MIVAVASIYISIEHKWPHFSDVEKKSSFCLKYHENSLLWNYLWLTLALFMWTVHVFFRFFNKNL